MSPTGRQPERSRVRPLLALAGVALAVLGVGFCLGPYGLVRFHDTFDNALFPEFFQAREILAHGLSFWVDKLGGLPSFASLYPPYGPLALYSLFLPPWMLGLAFDAAAILAAGYGLFRLLTEYLGADRRAALLACIPFALTGYSYQSLTFFNFFPLFFMLTADVSGPGTWRFRLPRVLGLLLLTYDSMPVLTLPVYSVLHLLLVLLFDETPWRKRRIAAAFLVWTGYALFFAPTLLSLLAYAPLSNRILAQPPPFTLAQFFITFKDVYGYTLNICMLLAAALYFAFDAKNCRPVRRALLLSLGLAATILLSPDSVKPLFGNTPFKYVDFYHYSGALIVTLPLLVGLGASHLLRTGMDVSWKRAALCLVLTAFMVSTDNLLLKACMLLFVLGGVAAVQAAGRGDIAAKRRLGLAAGLCGLGLAAGVVQMQTLLMMDHSFVPYAKGFGHHRTLTELAREAERDPFRVAGINLSPAVAQSHGLDTADLLTQIYSRQYRDYFQAILAPQLDTDAKRANYPNVAYREAFLVPVADTFTTRRFLVYNKNAPTSADMWNLPLLSAMNVRYLLSPRPVEGLSAQADLEAVDNGPGAPVAALVGTSLDAAYRLPIYVYRLHESFPRGWLTSGAIVLPDEAAVRSALERETLGSLASRALLARADADALPEALRRPAETPADRTKAAAPEALPLVSHSSGRFEWAGSIAAPRLLVVSNNFHPGWRAQVNGAEVPVLRANHSFLALPLTQAGPVRVVLSFHEPLTAKAHVLTLLGVLLIASCALLGAGKGGGSATPPNGPEAPDTAELAWSGAGALAMRRALLWGLLGAIVTGLLFALLRAVREPADSQRLVWFILANALICGLLAAPVASRLLRQLLGPEPEGAGQAGPKEPI
ncbi:MAG TPA: DUF6044 family protein [Humidesulfovibrio sp.]|uniref:DUF6044 family protein n=1 Tax=Humidesulfovibrio sp. TaxID=2910988 RepID=UPI002C83B6BD|nr:DUF6044 family protein [Humidesulfovibrio sp.]HWR03898.1 DUF6044 family protein [Humidesulfovibrio sp.]